MKKSLITVVAIFALGLGCLMETGCSTAWVSTFDSVLSAVAPALIAILQIKAVSTGTEVDAALVSKINSDGAAAQSTAGDLAKASAAAAPGACSQFKAAFGVIESDLPAVLSVAQVSNKNTQDKIKTMGALVGGLFTYGESLIPACNTPALAKASVNFSGPPLSLKNFVNVYNTVLLEKSNDAAVDAITPKLKLHRHSKAVRMLTLGVAQ